MARWGASSNQAEEKGYQQANNYSGRSSATRSVAWAVQLVLKVVQVVAAQTPAEQSHAVAQAAADDEAAVLEASPGETQADR